MQSIVRLRQQHFFIGGENYNPWVQQFLSTDGEAPTPVGTTPREKSMFGKTKRLVKRMGTLIMPKDVRLVGRCVHDTLGILTLVLTTHVCM